jgi:hypothetical protein
MDVVVDQITEFRYRSNSAKINRYCQIERVAGDMWKLTIPTDGYRYFSSFQKADSFARKYITGDSG